MASLIPMSEPNAAPVLPTLSLEIPATPADSSSGNGSTAQPTPTNAPVPLPPTMPQISLTFLMISGRRRSLSFEPNTPVGRVKELVWNSWPAEWSDERPPAPNYLRILYLGRMLQDEDILESIHNPLTGISPSAGSPLTPQQPQSMIVHLSIRPVPPPGEADDLKKKKKKKRSGRGSASASSGAPQEEGNFRTGCCTGCVIC